ncbi:LacI family DNA-binding transcriptional regulator [Wenyingzhuangia sp. chi5]|uniref:LacI family DNA-binding transcriptional regulator n=1 Tax=Wenyingzhuangia gilva TaxID=3057677 RepID=A0ABT8VQW5_9FLAO|nr:LacI family DNA-binding transcriptional regulator [Wenyingzhuangia sp. chi5]MDO3694361.1 LacI family DNA-binding transcriptional regulator [Wenyingzhuangia sp. chi5]
MKKKTTIHDISKALKINSSTVSRALNNSPRVSQKTKDLIQKKAVELGYQKNILASNLRTNKTNTIGIIVPRISRNFFSSVISGIEETAYRAGYNVVIGQSLESLEREQELVSTLLSNRVDGLLISVSMGTTNYNHLSNFKTNGGPIVFFDRPMTMPNIPSITIDDYEASYNATQHLIENGCKNIVHFSGFQKIELYKRRMQGYVAALTDNNIPVRPEYILESQLSEADGIELAKKVISLPKVDGIYSSNDTAAISAMQYFKKNGLKIPDDIAIVGFNNDSISAVIEPGLTTVNQPDVEMGIIASSLLIELIKKTIESPSEHSKTLGTELIIRQSSQKS